jgi:undecaprenyl pyrophosphate synthase
MRGTEQIVKAGDMTISDGAGIISNIIYGPDGRTQITESTRNVIFTVYAPGGITEQVITQHLQDMRDYVLVIAPRAEVELLRVFN